MTKPKRQPNSELILGHKPTDLDDKKCFLTLDKADEMVFPDEFISGMKKKKVSKILVNEANVKHMATKVDLTRILGSHIIYEYIDKGGGRYKIFVDQYDDATNKNKLLTRWLKALLIGGKKNLD